MSSDLQRWPFDRRPGAPLLPPLEYADRREKCPFDKVEMWNGEAAWMATRYEDVRMITRMPEMSSDPWNGFMPAPTEAALKSQMGKRRFFDKIDDPEHANERAAVATEFTLKQVENYRGYVDSMCEELLDEMEKQPDPVDIFADFAREVPSRLTCRFIGIPESEAPKLRDLVARAHGQAGSSGASKVEAGFEEILDYFGVVIDEVETRPRDDFASRLVHNSMLTGDLSRERTRSILAMMLVGGFDTTAAVIALSIVVLLENPEQLARVLADPELWPRAVEELLRYIAPSRFNFARIAKEDVLIAGKQVSAGEGIIASLASANFDPERYPDPESLDVERDARGHFTFGFGIHQCVAHNLARMEVAVALEHFFQRFPHARLLSQSANLEFLNYNVTTPKEVFVDLHGGVR